ncbi:MAG TPA: YeeE/YedE thiosulfate transporter family protein [Syntrophales bacterium]|nr:YeeE/YedE thiosulfate transporter family protein [Syntrophales bacterium]
MMDWLGADRWSPYAVGVGIGLLSWLTLLLSDRFIGASTAFARTSGMIERLFRGEAVLTRPYYRKFVPEIDWEWMFVLGIVLGALGAAFLSGSWRLLTVPDRWAASFGDGFVLRWAAALAGGVLMGLGARWAGGCTSGHGISGTMQLGVTSWLAAVCFFLGGIVTARLLFLAG